MKVTEDFEEVFVPVNYSSRKGNIGLNSYIPYIEPVEDTEEVIVQHNRINNNLRVKPSEGSMKNE